MLTTRINVMFDRKSWDRLKTIAKKQSCTTSELVRRAVHEQYLSEAAKQRRKAYKAILDMRPEAVASTIDYKKLVEDGRRV
jgi:hypothetical protein